MRCRTVSCTSTKLVTIQPSNMDEELVRPRPIYPAAPPPAEVTCEICGSSFPEEINMGMEVAELLKPQRPVRELHQACPPCSLVYVQVVSSNNADSPAHCDKCPSQFKSQRGLRQHIGKVHTVEEKSISCSECSKKFKHKHAVKFHVKQVHDKATRVNCFECGKECYNKYTLQTHVKNEHPAEV